MKVNERMSSSDISVCASALKPPFKVSLQRAERNLTLIGWHIDTAFRLRELIVTPSFQKEADSYLIGCC